MSEMSLGSVTPADLLNESLIAFTGCVGEAVEDICSYGLTIGESYVPFDPDENDDDEDDDCGEDEAACSQLWVRVTNITPLSTEGFDGGTCSSILRIGLEVGILRCFEINEGGEAPNATQVLLAATQGMDDMNAIYCAAMACEVWEAINVGEWTPTGPLGGQYGGIWTFTVER